MTTEELAELFLVHLYELAEEAPHPNFLFSIDGFVSKIGISDREEAQKAINHLGDRGFIIPANFDRLGGMSAAITIEGSIFVEKGGETGVMEQYRKNLHTLTKTASDLFPSPTDQGRTKMVNEEKQDPFFARRKAETLLDDIEEVLERNETMAMKPKEI